MQCMQQVVRSNLFTFVSSLSKQAVNKVMLSVGFEQFINLFCIYTGSWIKYMNIEVLGKNVLFVSGRREILLNCMLLNILCRFIKR